MTDILATSASIEESRTKQHVIQSTHTKYSREMNRKMKNDNDRIPMVSSESSRQKEVVKGEVRNGMDSDEIGGVRYVRLNIHSPATEWGSSIWRLQLWGYEIHGP